jgi:hypothetical protein
VLRRSAPVLKVSAVVIYHSAKLTEYVAVVKLILPKPEDK